MKKFSILDFGAIPETMCTTAIQHALDRCALEGGIVYIPSGTFLTGTLYIHSNTTIILENGSVLKGSGNITDYSETGYIHNEFGMVKPLIYAIDEENIKICGKGTIDFNGFSFFDMHTPHDPSCNVETLTKEQKREFAVKPLDRPNQLLFFRNCNQIHISDITLLDAPCWGIVCSSCMDIEICNIKINYNQQFPNADGIHLSACHNVLIDQCDIISGDDCVAITGIDDWDKKSYNIILSNCKLSSSSAGIRIGYWISQVENVTIDHCDFYQCTRGICICASSGGLVQNVTVTGCKIDTHKRVGGWWGSGEPLYVLGLSHIVKNNYKPLTMPNPTKTIIRNILFNRIQIISEGPVVCVGENNIQNVVFSDITFEKHKEVLYGELDLKPTVFHREFPSDNQNYWGYFEGIEKLHVRNLVTKADDKLASIHAYIHNPQI